MRSLANLMPPHVQGATFYHHMCEEATISLNLKVWITSAEKYFSFHFKHSQSSLQSANTCRMFMLSRYHVNLHLDWERYSVCSVAVAEHGA